MFSGMASTLTSAWWLQASHVAVTAHLDHNPSNNKPRNLEAYCQHCHILHDRDEHAAGGGSLFERKMP
jgi:hypothetical protein